LSRPAEAVVACPECHHRQTLRTWDSIDGPEDPELKQELLTGTLHAFTCGKCGHAAAIARTLLYRDRAKGVMIHWIVQPDPVTTSGMQVRYEDSPVCRLVRSRDDLLEKIRILDDGLDDRVVELAKYILGAQLAKERGEDELRLWYLGPAKGSKRGLGDVEFVVECRGDHDTFPVPRVFLDEMTKKFTQNAPDPTKERGRWLEVDRGYVQGWLQQLRQPKEP
jgi:hypothetical protein